MSNTIFETMIRHWIKKIKEAGFNDPTKELIKYNHGNNKIVIQLYTESQWNNKIKANAAKSVASRFGFEDKPNHVITVDDIQYYVEILSK